MEQQIASGHVAVKDVTTEGYNVSRRRFFQTAGGLAGVGILLAACHKSGNNGVSVGTGDTGILNYAYVLEQLEASFYIQVMATPYTGMTTQEQLWLGNLRNHEIAHREFLKTALGSNAIGAVQTNFSSIDFTSRTAVLTAAKTFEDLGVAAYNGIASSIANTDYMLVAGKIASVEARHAAYIRDLLSPGTFADSTVINYNGFDNAMTPSQVMSAASAYLTTKIDVSQI